MSRQIKRGLRLETLEARLPLDAQGVTLVADTFDLRQNGSQTELKVLANDAFTADYQGDRQITSVSFGSEGGQIAIGPDGDRLVYTPPADFFGTETFVYAVDGTHTASVRVNVQAPLADDRYEIPPTGAVESLDVLGNDPFWAGYTGQRQITSVSVGSAGGQVEIAPDGQSINYIGSTDGGTKETFIYVVDNLYPARVTIDLPIATKPDKASYIEHDPAKTINVLANDPFWQGYTGERRITHVTESYRGGEVRISDDGQSVIYTGDFDYGDASSGRYQTSDSFRYVVDGQYEQTVTVTVARPVRNDQIEVDENSADTLLDVLANEWLPNEINAITGVTTPDSGGTVTIGADGKRVLYTPAVGFTGYETLTYTVDGKHEASVRVHVTRPVRDDSFGFGSVAGVYQDTAEQVLDVLTNDFLGNDYVGERVITSAGPTENGGTVTISDDGKALIYAPADGYTGNDSFTYTVDGVLTATVSLRVSALAQDKYDRIDHYRLGESYTFDLSANDYFDEGYTGEGKVTAVEMISGTGDFSYTANGLLTYTPTGSGTTVFSYVVDDLYEARHSIGLRQQTRSDLVPVDQNSADNSINVLANDFPHSRYYSYSGPKRVTGVSPASANGGVVTVSEDGRSAIYTPPADFYGRDTFTYTVDDFWTETVSVEVIRRVRDDVFRADTTEGTQSLPVLVNDLFGANYSGVGRITDVTATASGGVVSIDADGGALLYTPAAGFSGTDTFTYTVDGVLKAEVSVVVNTPSDERFPTFSDADEYLDFLLQDAIDRYSYLFGNQAWGWEVTNRNLTAFDSDALSDGSTRNHSETNVQVAGVDEGDIVEFDSDYSYVLTSEGVTIVDAWPAEELSVASRIEIEGRPLVEFLQGDRLTVISETGGYQSWYGGQPWYGGTINDSLIASDLLLSDDYIWPPYSRIPSETIITVIDVSDRTSPEVVQTTTMEGRYVDSRSVEGQVYALVSNDQSVLPRPEVIDEDGDPTTPNRYETVEEYTARVQANRGALIEDALPSYTTTGTDGTVIRTGLLNTPDTIHRPLTNNADTLISIVSIDAASDSPGLSDTSAVYSTGAGTIYASLDSFYVFDADYTSEDGSVTRVVKFDWDPASGGIELASSTTVPGSIINQFSADENDDTLRIATTASNRGSGNWSNRDENLLFTLQEDDGVMEVVGSIQNWALGEDIRSVRFLGDRAFVTTYRNVDPLFALDLSDAANPVAVGHITLPGFTSYMHLVDQNHLLTVGTNTPGGSVGPTQVSLFDISDLTQPRRLDEHTFTRFTTSEAEIDHHAFGYFAEHGLLAMPIASRYIERTDTDGDGYSETRSWRLENQLAVFTVDVSAEDPDSRLQLSAQIDHDSTVRRSGYIGDKLYSVGRDEVKVVDVNALDTVIAEVTVSNPAAPVSSDSFYDDDSLRAFPVLGGSGVTPLVVAPIDPREQAIAKARADLAERLGLAVGAPLLVTAESAPTAPGGGETIVFEVDDEAYVYRLGNLGRIASGDARYGVDPDASVWNALTVASTATANPLVGDVNRDGVVNTDDTAALGDTFGTWSLTEHLSGDMNGDGVIDLLDLDLLGSNFGKSLPASNTVSALAADAAGAAAFARDLAFEDLRTLDRPLTDSFLSSLSLPLGEVEDLQRSARDASLLLISSPTQNLSSETDEEPDDEPVEGWLGSVEVLPESGLASDFDALSTRSQ